MAISAVMQIIRIIILENMHRESIMAKVDFEYFVHRFSIKRAELFTIIVTNVNLFQRISPEYFH